MSDGEVPDGTQEVLPPEGRAVLPEGAIPVASGGYLTPWQPGKSGNPAGRSKRFHEVTAAAQDKSMEAIEKLGKLMNCGDERVELMAASALLDRAFGKPKEQKTEDSQLQRPDLSKLDAEDLAALRRVMGKLAASAVADGVAPVIAKAA